MIAVISDKGLKGCQEGLDILYHSFTICSSAASGQGRARQQTHRSQSTGRTQALPKHCVYFPQSFRAPIGLSEIPDSAASVSMSWKHL